MSTVEIRDGSKDALAQIYHLRDVALTEGAIIVEGECIVRCPVDTGHLRGSINRRVRLTGSIDGQETVGGLVDYPEKIGEAHIGTNVEYGPHVEYGTRLQKAQPYMRPGAVAAVPQVERRFKERLGQEIKVTKVEVTSHVV